MKLNCMRKTCLAILALFTIQLMSPQICYAVRHVKRRVHSLIYIDPIIGMETYFLDSKGRIVGMPLPRASYSQSRRKRPHENIPLPNEEMFPQVPQNSDQHNEERIPLPDISHFPADFPQIIQNSYQHNEERIPLPDISHFPTDFPQIIQNSYQHNEERISLPDISHFPVDFPPRTYL